MDHSYTHTVHGHDNQILEITLQPGQTIHAENGSMCYMTQDVRMRTGTGKGRGPLALLKRKTSGEGILLSIFENEGQQPATIGLSPSHPSRIFPIDIDDTNPADIICKRSNFLAGHPDVRISLAVAPARAAAFANANLFMQRLQGQGQVFLAADGALVRKTLAQGETYITEPDALTAFEDSITWGVKTTTNPANILWSKEKIFLLSLEGPGTVWFHSTANLDKRIRTHLASLKQA